VGEPFYLNTGSKKAQGCIWQMVLEKAWAGFVPRANDALYKEKRDPAKSLTPSYQLLPAHRRG